MVPEWKWVRTLFHDSTTSGYHIIVRAITASYSWGQSKTSIVIDRVKKRQLSVVSNWVFFIFSLDTFQEAFIWCVYSSRENSSPPCYFNAACHTLKTTVLICLRGELAKFWEKVVRMKWYFKVLGKWTFTEGWIAEEWFQRLVHSANLRLT